MISIFRALVIAYLYLWTQEKLELILGKTIPLLTLFTFRIQSISFVCANILWLWWNEKVFFKNKTKIPLIQFGTHLSVRHLEDELEHIYNYISTQEFSFYICFHACQWCLEILSYLAIINVKESILTTQKKSPHKLWKPTFAQRKFARSGRVEC